MDLPVWIVLFCLLGSLFSVLVAALFLILPAAMRSRLVPNMVSLAIGALLAAAFVGLLPRSLKAGGAGTEAIGATLLAGIILFFLLEKMVLWRHSHSGHAEQGAHGDHTPGASAAGPLILIGDGIHNLVDGVLIGAAFLTDVRLGILTSLAVAAHEIPQELGDFVILLNAGFRASTALLLNLLTGAATVVGGLLAYWTLGESWLPYVLALAAASFIYIAVADHIPGLHPTTGLAATVRQLALIVLGAALVLSSHILLPQA
jgi:zinc and cadmium transporter